MYDSPRFEFFVWHLQQNKWTYLKTNSLLSFIPNYFDICIKFSYKIAYPIINHDFYFITFWMHYTHFIIIFGRKINLIAIVDWIFHISHFWDYLWCLLWCLYLTVFYFYHLYFHIQYNCYSKNYLLLLVCNNFVLLHAQKDF